MKRAQLIGLTIAASAGLGAFFLMRSMLSGPSEPTKVEVRVNATEVLVASRDLSLGDITKGSDFHWQAWPSDGINPDFITKKQGEVGMTSVTNAVVKSAITLGEPINRKKLVKAGQGGVMAALLPAGMRAVSTKIKEETAAGQLILPNDRVDVILIRKLPLKDKQQANEELASDTLLEDVRVLAIGQQIEAKQGTKSAEVNSKTATLELTPQQAQMLALANSMGEITLALRSLGDSKRPLSDEKAADQQEEQRPKSGPM